MSLISKGSTDLFTVIVSDEIRKQFPVLGNFKTIGEFEQAIRKAQPIPLEGVVSKEKRGLRIKSIRLNKGFEGILGNVFDKKNEIYIVSFCWDLSKNPPSIYPSIDTSPDSFILPIKVNQTYDFDGKPLVIFPPREVTAGLAYNIFLLESDKDRRKISETIEKLATEYKQSDLSMLLTMSGTVTKGTTTLISSILEGALKLLGKIGSFLKADSDDYVDLIKDTLPVEDEWEEGDIVYDHEVCSVTLTRFTE